MTSHTPARQRRPCKETARRGREIYERNIRRQVEADHHGKTVAIDVESGDRSIGDTVIAATALLRAQRPEAADVWSERVGYRALRSF